MLWPVMQCGWIKVRSVGPHQHSDFGIDPNLVKQLQVAQGAVQLAHQNRLEIDGLLAPVVKTNAKRVSRDNFERADSMNRMSHKVTYFKGSMGRGFRPSCNRCQSAPSSA